MEKWLEEKSKSLHTNIEKLNVDLRVIEDKIRKTKERAQGINRQFGPLGYDNVPEFYQPPIPNLE